MKLSLTIYLTVILGISCSYNSEEELYNQVDCSFENISYSDDILPLITTNCYDCHSAAANFGNINLEGHDQLSKFALNGQLLGSIKHTSGFSPMPQNRAQLVECNIEEISQWISEGALNN